MTARLTILLAGDVLSTLRSGKSATFEVGGTRERAAAPAGDNGARPKAGTLPARVLGWAKDRKKPFETADIERRFKLSRAHASMILSRLASGSPIRRERRGLYAYDR